MQKRVIGTKYLTYAEQRNIALNYNHYEIRRVKDLYVYLAAAHLRLKKQPNQDYMNAHLPLGLDNCVGYHFWNAASISRKPWVTTLELPCTDEKRLKKFTKPQCRKIFCLSSWVLTAQIRLLENTPFADDILPKLELLHPPQAVSINEEHFLKKSFLAPYKFIFIGRDFFRKGGYECVRAFDRLIKEGYETKLTLITKMDTNDYPYPAHPTDLGRAIQLIEQPGNHITLFQELPHKQVLEQIESSHIGLLPTYLDSYGYSVLEFFSYGIPAITTSINALAEINNSERGWMLDLPMIENKYGLKRFDRQTLEQRQNLSDLLTDVLYNCVKSIIENPTEIKSKGVSALTYIQSNHQPSKNVQIIESVYDKF